MATAQAQLEEDRSRLQTLIAELPVHDGKLPINDIKDGSVVTDKGAHGVANVTEAEITGIIKRYAVTELLNEATVPGANIASIADKIASLVGSYEGAEKLPTNTEAASARLEAKIAALAFDEPVQGLVRAIATDPTTADLQPGSIPALPDIPLSALIDEKPPEGQSLRELAQGKHYQMTDEGHLYNQSSVRLGYVDGRPGLNGLMTTFHEVSDDQNKKKESVGTFIRNMGDSIWLEGRDSIHIYDIGYGGNPETAIAAIDAIKALKPEIKIHYTGMDIMSSEEMEGKAREALINAGVTEDCIKFERGTFGIGKKAPDDEEPKDSVDNIVRSHQGQMDLVLATHVYNIGNNNRDATTFVRQIEELQAPNALAVIQHERGESWINDIRNDNTDSMRGGATTVVEDIGGALETARSQMQMPYSDFSSASTARFPEFKDEYLDIIRTMPAGKYTDDYAAGLGTAEKGEFQTLVNLLEFYMRAPLEAFEPDQRMKIVDEIKTEVERSNGKTPGQVSSYTDIQIAPQRDCSVELQDAVEAAARASGRELAPSAENSRGTGTNHLGARAGL